MTQYDFIGLGIGPSNLSLAALSRPIEGIRHIFLDRKDRFDWHGGAMLPGALLQVSFLKDLVTLVDPTNELTFLNFLVQHGRMYQSLIANRGGCTRLEFSQYYKWAAEKTSSLRWNRDIESVTISDGKFVIQDAHGDSYSAKRVVLGTGRSPHIPRPANVVVN